MGGNIGIPNFVGAKLPKSKKANAALGAALAAVAGAAVLVAVHATTTSGTGAVVIPPPAAVSAKATKTSSASSLPLMASPPHMARLPRVAKPSPVAVASQPPIPSPPPVAGSSYAGTLLLNATGSQLASWNQTSTYCPENSWQIANGTVATDSFGDATEGTTGQTGSCVAMISPGAYPSAVIEAYINFPALPGKSSTIADWTSFWLTDQANWPANGELDAVEAEPATGVNAVAWHGGTAQSEISMSTDGYAPNGTLPVDGPNLSPGWHIVDIVYTKGYFAVYYDGKQFTSLSNGIVTGAPLNILITTSVTPANSQVEQQIGTAPVNSDSSPATVRVKYVKVWAFK